LPNRRSSKPVLVVEDYPDAREMMELVLRLAGFDVCSASDGLEALACLAEKRPGLILLDLSMPRMDGIEFGRELRRHPDPVIARTPIILMTALSETAEASRVTGAVEVLTKPVSMDLITQMVASYSCR
jgi:CheY-like chemotaxis protein